VGGAGLASLLFVSFFFFLFSWLFLFSYHFFKKIERKRYPIADIPQAKINEKYSGPRRGSEGIEQPEKHEWGHGRRRCSCTLFVISSFSLFPGPRGF
jgi:hypothetical protein